MVMFVLPFVLVVSTPATNSLVANTACWQCSLIVKDRKFLSIPRIVWMTLHHVLLDCTNKTVMFPNSVVSDYLNSYTFKKGSLALLNSIVAEEKKNGDIRSTPIVQDYADVFPEEGRGLPPVRETEFSIDVMPGTGAISIIPYRMALTEMAELGK